MHSLPSFSKTARLPGIAALLLAAALCVFAPFHTACAADAITTTTHAVSKFGSFLSKHGNPDPATVSSASDRLNRSILALPFGILRTVATGISNAARRVVTSHVTKN